MRELSGNRGCAVIIKTGAINQRLIQRQTKKSGARIAALSLMRDGSDFDKAKAERRKLSCSARVLIKTGGESNRIGE
jgi:hypothetical protein